MKKFLWLWIPLFFLNCNGQIHLTLEEKEAQNFSLLLEGDGVVASGIMSYFEDVDLLQDRQIRADGLPHAFDELLVFIRPYVNMVRVERLKGNHIRYHLEIDDLIRFQQRFTQDGYQLIQFSQDASGLYHLRFAMSEGELRLFYDAMSMLPKVPHTWNRNNRKSYIQQVANVFGSTKNERARLEQELDQATITLHLTAPNNTKEFIVKSPAGVIKGKERTVDVTLNVIDFLTGNDYIEMQWM